MSRPNYGSLQVVKLGGSLLQQPDLRQRVDSWRSSAPVQPRLWLVGGGALVDALRQLQVDQQLPDLVVHWLAIDALTITRDALCAVLPDVAPAGSLHEAELRFAAGANDVAIAVAFELRKTPAALPASWDVTSDSLAAWLALRVGAERLTLLKSVSLAPGETLVDSVAKGKLDRHFPSIGYAGAVDWVNLRTGECRSFAELKPQPTNGFQGSVLEPAATETSPR